MRPIIFVLLSCIIIFTGCQSKTRQAKILSEEEMGKVTWDLMVADDYISNYFRDSTKDVNKERLGLYLRVLKMHKVSKRDYDASLKYYSSKPDKMKVIFDTLSTRKRREGEKPEAQRLK